MTLQEFYKVRIQDYCYYQALLSEFKKSFDDENLNFSEINYLEDVNIIRATLPKGSYWSDVLGAELRTCKNKHFQKIFRGHIFTFRYENHSYGFKLARCFLSDSGQTVQVDFVEV